MNPLSALDCIRSGMGSERRIQKPRAAFCRKRMRPAMSRHCPWSRGIIEGRPIDTVLAETRVLSRTRRTSRLIVSVVTSEPSIGRSRLPFSRTLRNRASNTIRLRRLDCRSNRTLGFLPCGVAAFGQAAVESAILTGASAGAATGAKVPASKPYVTQAINASTVTVGLSRKDLFSR